MELKNKLGQTEKEFLATYDSSMFPHPSVTADCVMFALSLTKPKLHVLLIKRGDHPSIGKWALAGGFVEPEETTDHAAQRELVEETGIEHVQLELVGVMSEPHRDPRTWVITTVYTTLLDADAIHPKAGDDAAEAAWFEVDVDLIKTEKQKLSIGFTETQTINLVFTHKSLVLLVKLIKTIQVSSQGKQLSYRIVENELMAFDHPIVVLKSLEKIQEPSILMPRLLNILGPQFEVSTLQSLLEKVLFRPIKAKELQTYVSGRMKKIPKTLLYRPHYK